MTDTDSAADALARLEAFQTATEELRAALAAVEDTISRNQAARDSILEALGQVGGPAGVPEPDKSSSRKPRKGASKKTAAVAVADPEAVTPPEDEAPLLEEAEQPAEVVEHLPSGETQEAIAVEAAAEGTPLEEAFDDWEPGEIEGSSSEDGYSNSDIDQIQF